MENTYSLRAVGVLPLLITLYQHEVLRALLDLQEVHAWFIADASDDAVAAAGYPAAHLELDQWAGGQSLARSHHDERPSYTGRTLHHTCMPLLLRSSIDQLFDFTPRQERMTE